MKRKVLEKYGYDHNGKLDYRNPVYVDYDVDDKIKYYGKRRNDISLSKEQREYADKKYRMLTTGIGRIYITSDEDFKGKKGSIRRVMISDIADNKDDVLVNRITSSNKSTTRKLRNDDVPILQNESYLDQQCYLKKKKSGGKNFKISEMHETTSTINPYDYGDSMRFIFKKESKYKNDNLKLSNYLHKRK